MKACQFPRNARFWALGPRAGLVRLTLRPGQSLTHFREYYTCEGHSCRGSTWSHEGDAIREDWADAGRDCDGFHRTAGTRTAPLQALAAVPFCSEPEILRPDWQDGPTECRDAFAAAAGY